MRTRWFADPAEDERLDETLLRLVGAISRMLDGLASPPVAPGTGRIDAAAAAVVLPHAGVPGCSLVLQVAAWVVQRRLLVVGGCRPADRPGQPGAVGRAPARARRPGPRPGWSGSWSVRW